MELCSKNYVGIKCSKTEHNTNDKQNYEDNLSKSGVKLRRFVASQFVWNRQLVICDLDMVPL